MSAGDLYALLKLGIVEKQVLDQFEAGSKYGSRQFFGSCSLAKVGTVFLLAAEDPWRLGMSFERVFNCEAEARAAFQNLRSTFEERLLRHDLPLMVQEEIGKPWKGTDRWTDPSGRVTISIEGALLHPTYPWVVRLGCGHAQRVGQIRGWVHGETSIQLRSFHWPSLPHERTITGRCHECDGKVFIVRIRVTGCG